MLCSAARESPLAHSEHPFFKRLQLVKRPYPCFLTPLQCFVQQQGKANLPTLNMPLFYKVHLVQSSNPCFLTPANALFSSKGKPTCPLCTSLLQKTATCKRPISMFLNPTSMLCSAARESPLAHSEHAPLLQSPPFTIVQSMFLDCGQCFVQQQGKAHLPTLNMREQRPPCPNAQSMLFDSSQCFVQQQGKAHLPTLNILLPKSATSKKATSMFLDPTKSKM